MIDTAEERRRAFSVWLRSGRLTSVRSADGVELKFNPWHDVGTGRFTFVGAGRRYGQWGDGGTSGSGGKAGSGGGPARVGSRNPVTPPSPTGATRRASPGTGSTSSQPPGRGTWAGGGFTGGGGGDFGGGGATAKEPWGVPGPRRPAASSRAPATATGLSHPAGGAGTNAAPPTARPEQFRTVVRNGYSYQIDARERTRRVTGMLTVAASPSRSRTSQRQAGGAERRASDDGGHYVAARFNGPTEAFNHFAQDANINRGGYRRLEDEWAREKRAERTVTVKIVPQFGGGSIRPSTINVWWTVDGRRKSARFLNERSEKPRGRK